MRKYEYKYGAYIYHKKRMTPDLNKYEILRNDYVRKANITKETYIIALHNKLNKLKEENLKLL